MAKIVSVTPLAADPMKNKLVLDDGTVAHVLKDGPTYEVGQEYESPLEAAPAPTKTKTTKGE